MSKFKNSWRDLDDDEIEDNRRVSRKNRDISCSQCGETKNVRVINFGGMSLPCCPDCHC